MSVMEKDMFGKRTRFTASVATELGATGLIEMHVESRCGGGRGGGGGIRRLSM